MVFFSHWIANCCCTQQPLYLISAVADGSGLWQLHFPYRSMAAYADHRWLWIFDAAVFFSLKHIIYTARTSAVLFTKIFRSNEGLRRGYCKLYYRAARLIKRTNREKKNGKKKLDWLLQSIERRFQQTSVCCVGTSLTGVRPDFYWTSQAHIKFASASCLCIATPHISVRK